MDSRSSSGVKTFIVTSSKGGVGKSTVAANLAAAVAKSGKRVLLIDCDLSNRSLDFILGCDDGSLCDFCDLVSGRADAAKTMIDIERVPGLYLFPRRILTATASPPSRSRMPCKPPRGNIPSILS